MLRKLLHTNFNSFSYGVGVLPVLILNVRDCFCVLVNLFSLSPLTEKMRKNFGGWSKGAVQAEESHPFCLPFLSHRFGGFLSARIEIQSFRFCLSFGFGAFASVYFRFVIFPSELAFLPILYVA